MLKLSLVVLSEMILIIFGGAIKKEKKKKKPEYWNGIGVKRETEQYFVRCFLIIILSSSWLAGCIIRIGKNYYRVKVILGLGFILQIQSNTVDIQT